MPTVNNKKKDFSAMTPDELRTGAIATGQQAGQDYQQEINKANEDYQRKTAAAIAGAEQAMSDANQKENQAAVTYQSMIDNFVKQQEQYKAEQEAKIAKQEKNDYNAQLYGGLTEGIASLVNLIGTTRGASNQNIQSQQPEWRQRIDTLRQQREAKLDNLRTQLQTLQAQKAQVQYNLGAQQAKTARDTATAMFGYRSQANQVAYQGAVAGAEAAYKTSAQDAANMINVGNAMADDLRADRNLNANIQQQIATEKQYGYDRKTGKYWNSVTGKWDLDGPEHVRGVSNYNNNNNVNKNLGNIDGLRDAYVAKISNNAFKSYDEYKAALNIDRKNSDLPRADRRTTRETANNLKSKHRAFLEQLGEIEELDRKTLDALLTNKDFAEIYRNQQAGQTGKDVSVPDTDIFPAGSYFDGDGNVVDPNGSIFDPTGKLIHYNG